ncbi:unnamed protein product [Linum tenue]|uniref:Gnk2-homologous domain-containing protein n=1 Tax=Linum tenue TaxID=586396 RepID=A0AAV0RAW5_9ROSI|nr:unnamed protein product [Linum tenue]
MKTNPHHTKSFSLVVLIASLIFSDGIYIVVAKGYNIDKIGSGCGKQRDPSNEMRLQALHSIDSAILAVVSGSPNACGKAPDSTIYAAANCARALSDEECKLCLYNAQFRVVDVDCKHLFGGWLVLKDCYVRYDTDTAFCRQ